MPDVLISLGGNAGDVSQTFRQSLRLLSATPGISLRDVSRFISTEGVTLGQPPGPVYLNAAARLETSHDPHTLLALLLDLERRAGRIREQRWSVRPLDLDLLYYDGQILNTPGLVLPHPAAWYRRFVLDPLVTIAPEFLDPVKQRTIHELRDRLLVRPLTLGVINFDNARLERLQSRFSKDLFQIVNWSPGDGDPTFLIAPASNHPASLPGLPLVTPWPTDRTIEEFIPILAESALGERDNADRVR